MKRLVLMLSIIAAAAFVFGACNQEEKADLAWTNGNTTTNNINKIIWASGDATWTRGDVVASTDGYAPGESTEYQEVTELTGDVICSVWDGTGDFVEAKPTIVETGDNDNTLSLNDGDRKIFTLRATAK